MKIRRLRSNDKSTNVRSGHGGQMNGASGRGSVSKTIAYLLSKIKTNNCSIKLISPQMDLDQLMRIEIIMHYNIAVV